MSGIADFHSHILPGMDDGSGSVEESIAMLQAEAAQGIQRVVATPHFYANHDTLEGFLSRREAAETRLRREMRKHAGMPELYVGAEVYFFSGISHCDALQALTVTGTDCVLIEMPTPPWSEAMYQELGDLRKHSGITPIIAHVDRYIGPWRTRGIPERLARLPVFVQANASFVLQPGTRRMAMKMLRKGQIQLLGSDCHNMTARVPNLGAAVEAIRQSLGEETLARICAWQNEAMAVGQPQAHCMQEDLL